MIQGKSQAEKTIIEYIDAHRDEMVNVWKTIVSTESPSIEKAQVDKVGQITFAGQYSPDTQEVLYITERAVFKLIDGKMTLIEIAPGLDLQKDVLDQMGFTPCIAEDLKTMDPAIFEEDWGGLSAYFAAE